MPVIHLIGIGFSVYLIWSLPWQTWVRFAVWLVVGLCVYFGYSRTHSKLNAAAPAAATPSEQ
jgi:APA family basic amino acid/polyamine antiporter